MWPQVGKYVFKQVTKSTNGKGKGSNKKEETINYIKIKNFIHKDSIKRMKRQATGVEDKIFATN